VVRSSSRGGSEVLHIDLQELEDWKILRYDEAAAKAAGRPVGSVLTIGFEIEGQKFTAPMAVRSSNLMRRSRLW
jgi:hypothetical protein